MKDDEKKKKDNAEVQESEKLADESQDVANDGAGEITLEQFKDALENNIECKGYFDSLCDRTVNTRLDKGIESWKEKNLNNLIEEEINIRYPQKSETEIALEKAQEEKRQLELQVKYQNLMSENKIPLELLDFIAGKDMEDTVQRIERFSNLLVQCVNSGVDERLKGTSYIPPGGNYVSISESEDLWKLML